jgi:hypothetical protein
MPLTKVFGVPFEVSWMEELGSRSHDGVWGAVSGLCRALSECVSDVGNVPTGEV